MQAPGEPRAGTVPAVLSTPVYGERLTVLHVLAPGASGEPAGEVARMQSAAGWRASVATGVPGPGELTGIDAVVAWGAAADARDVLGGRRPTVVVWEDADVRRALTRPVGWVRELRRAPATSLLLLPAGQAERYTRWGPPVPLAHRPQGLPAEDAVLRLSAWIARAYAFGRRPADEPAPSEQPPR